ncbi:MAG: dioxygenase [Candidatus Kerfeldbacteria bacterium]|nr:dioxygenase [Candidatus Kerfeldbacteria bacterium]
MPVNRYLLFLIPVTLLFLGASCVPQSLRVVNRSEPRASCTTTATPTQGIGPYYKDGSTERTDLRELGMPGDPLTISGTVTDTACNPLPGVWMDFWQADADGQYDNDGFRLRGHQFTDSEGRYTLTTIEPAQYPGRPQHIHVMLLKPDGTEPFTTQLFFSLSDQGTGESVNPALVLQFVSQGSDADASRRATFDFVLP